MPLTQAQIDQLKADRAAAAAADAKVDADLAALVPDPISPPPPPVSTLPTIANATATPNTVPSTGGPVSFNAEVTNAVKITLDGFAVHLPTSGVHVSKTHTYVLQAFNAAGSVASASIPVTVLPVGAPPPVVTPPPVVFRLDDLRPGYARTLGSYTANQSAPWPSPWELVADSGNTYDPATEAIYMAGGGHGPHNATTVRALPLTDTSPLLAKGFSRYQWGDLYPSMTPAQTAETLTGLTCNPDLDPNIGRYTSTGHPAARHTYNATFVKGGKFWCLQARALPFFNAVAWGGTFWNYDFAAGKHWFSPTWIDITIGDGPRHLDPVTGKLVYERRAPPPGKTTVPWPFDVSGVLDPVSGFFLVMNCDRGYVQRVWAYDDANDVLLGGHPATGPTIPAIEQPMAAHQVVHDAKTDTFYLLQFPYAGPDGVGGNPQQMIVYAVKVNRADWSWTCTKVPPKGDVPIALFSKRGNGAVDPVNRIVGVVAMAGYFHAFNLDTLTWIAHRIQYDVQPSQEAVASFHTVQFDPHSGCFIWLHYPLWTNVPMAPTTWAYRFDPTAVGGWSGVQSSATPFTVGTQKYPTLMAAAAAVVSGSTLTVDPGTYIGQAYDFQAKASHDRAPISNVTVICPNGRARFVGGLAGDKACFVVGSGWTFDGIEGQGVKGSSGGNGSMVKVEGAGFTMRNFYIADCENGILTGNTQPTSDLLFENGVAERCGTGDGRTHNFYIGDHRSVTWRNVISNDANVGHLFKSRCGETVLDHCGGYEGRASRSVDASDGGMLRLINGTKFKQDPTTNNANMIGYAMEMGPGTPHPGYPVNEIHIDPTCVLYNTRPGGVALQILPGFVVGVVDNQAQSGPDPFPSLP